MLTLSFSAAALIALAATLLVITGRNAVHALLCLVVSLLAVAVIFFLLGAPFAAALEVIVYAGAIMVTFVFVLMMLSLTRETLAEERRSMRLRSWAAPLFLGGLLFGEIVYVLLQGGPQPRHAAAVDPREVGLSLFGGYMLAVELAAFLLAAGLLGACHLARRER